MDDSEPEEEAETAWARSCGRSDPKTARSTSGRAIPPTGALDGTDQRGNQVMTALKLYTDAAPGLIHHIFSIHHAVIEQNEAYGDR